MEDVEESWEALERKAGRGEEAESVDWDEQEAAPVEFWDGVTEAEEAEEADAVEETVWGTVIWVEVVDKRVGVDFAWRSERALRPVLE